MKKLIIWKISVVILFLGGPLSATFMGSGGMAFSFILFFALNPLFSVFSGVYAGLNIRKLWHIPISVFVWFLFGAWLFFEMGEMAFLLYGGCYFTISVISMLITYFIKKRQ